jgi:putative zinc finger/helix-turn-helix YgiT family protein
MNRDELRRPSTVLVGDTIICPTCGDESVGTTVTHEEFSYGDGPSAVQLVAAVPLRTCSKCGFKFLDGDAEDAKHTAICRHLGVMTPDEVRSLREMCGLSRTEFARLTRLGEATLGRWERGALVQNAAYDQFLYLLSFPENLRRLRERDGRPVAAATRRPGELPEPRFPWLNADQLAQHKKAQPKFQLSLCGEAA